MNPPIYANVFTSALTFVPTSPLLLREHQRSKSWAATASHTHRCGTPIFAAALHRAQITSSATETSDTQANTTSTNGPQCHSAPHPSAIPPTLHQASIALLAFVAAGMTSPLPSLAVSTAADLAAKIQQAQEKTAGVVTDAAAQAVIDNQHASQIAADATSDNSLTSKILLWLCIGLLIYATVGSIILTINKFVVNRNDKREREWVKNRLEGKPFPSNMYLDEREDSSLPKDFPVKVVGNNIEPGGNRQNRRIVKKTTSKEDKKGKPSKKKSSSSRGVAEKPSKKKNSGNKPKRG